MKFVGAQAYSYQEVLAATENFKKEIGRGGFGPVFYGKLNNDQEVAIKVLDIASRQGSDEFFNEVCLHICFEMLYMKRERERERERERMSLEHNH